jgi:hypothetical protein
MPYAKDLAEALLKQEDIECIKPPERLQLAVVVLFFSTLC